MNNVYRSSLHSTAFGHNHDGSAVIRVIGVGGAGCNAVARMQADAIQGVEFIIANTDAQSLQSSSVTRRVRLGEALTRGLGSGGDPAIGVRAAQESQEELRSTLRGSDLVFITAGMGGGTGTGAAPLVAKLAHDIGALTIAVVSLPFSFEGQRRYRIALQGIEELRPYVDTLLIVPNERLLAIVDHHLPFVDALHIADDILRQGVRGISDLIMIPGLINLDFADVRAVIAGSGTALMAIGEGQGERRASVATQRAAESPLLQCDIRGARRIILNVTGGPDVTIMEIHEIASLVQSLAHPEATIIFGTVQDATMSGTIRVTIVATAFTLGFSQTSIREEVPNRPMLPQAQYHADSMTPESLLGDAWPLPQLSVTLTDEPTVALPALTPARVKAETDGNLPQVPLTTTTATDATPVSPPVETSKMSAQTTTDVDIPAFLRRK